MGNAKPWLGHGKGKKLHQVRQKTDTTGGNPRVDAKDNDVNSSIEVPDVVTRRGRQ